MRLRLGEGGERLSVRYDRVVSTRVEVRLVLGESVGDRQVAISRSRRSGKACRRLYLWTVVAYNWATL